MPLQRPQGFTLVEVLIALALSSVALLGLAAGQLKSLQYATNSFNYTLSLVQANNAIERTWANLCDLQDGTTAYDGAYYAAYLQPQINAYTLTPTPLPNAAFTNNLNISVSWFDARMASPNDSIIRINAQYPQICP
ncbi:MAG: prepilin-type N-terminal cleavage/methylation domain-containing protein [Colwellia sp.]